MSNVKTKKYYNYIVYSDGRVFSIDLNEFIPIKKHNRRIIIQLYINGKNKVIQLARLIAYCFCNPPEDYKKRYVQHIDGNYCNNCATNLKWNLNVTVSKFVNYYNNCSSEAQNNIRKKISITCKQKQISKGKNNPRFRYSILDENNNELLVSDVAKKLNLSLSGVYYLIRQVLQGRKAYKLQAAKLRIIDHK